MTSPTATHAKRDEAECGPKSVSEVIRAGCRDAQRVGEQAHEDEAEHHHEVDDQYEAEAFGSRHASIVRRADASWLLLACAGTGLSLSVKAGAVGNGPCVSRANSFSLWAFGRSARKAAVAQPCTTSEPAIREETIVRKVAKCGKNR